METIFEAQCAKQPIFVQIRHLGNGNCKVVLRFGSKDQFPWDDYHSAPRVRSKAVNVTAVLYPIMEYNLRAYNSSESYKTRGAFFSICAWGM